MISDKDLNELHLYALARVGNLETRRQIKELIDEVKELRAKVAQTWHVTADKESMLELVNKLEESNKRQEESLKVFLGDTK